MSTILPPSRLGRVEFFENHTATWNTNAVAIGTTTSEVAALTTKTAAARAAYNAQQLAHEQAKAATQTYYAAVKAMTDAGNDVIQEIKAKAGIAGESVYALALIPPPAVPGPVGPPGQPTDFTATLDPTGVLALAWKCANPAGSGGTSYQISRQIGTTGPMVLIGGAGQRKFLDDTVPAGTAQVTYRIMAFRTTATGTPAEFTVKFGAAPGTGEAFAAVVTAPKLAA